MHHIKSLAWQLLIFCLMGSMSAWAGDVVLDNFTIGNVDDDTSLIPTNDIFRITENLGQRHADNLFHSFFSFNIDFGETALFSGDPAIQNIISRVTGGDPSTIDGIIRSTIDGAGFWFINPAGMIIESNAVFDVSGSLALGAADFVEFENAERWYAFAPPAGETSTFSVAAPATFGFLDSNASLVINDLRLDQPDIDEFVLAGSIVTLNEFVIRTFADNNHEGNVEIFGRDITLNHSVIATLPKSENAGAIVITGTGNVLIRNSNLISQPQLGSSSLGEGSAGDILITGLESIIVTNALIGGDPDKDTPEENLLSFGGVAGDVILMGGKVDLSDTVIGTGTPHLGIVTGPTGAIVIDAKDNSLTLRSTRLDSFALGSNDSGSITLKGRDVWLDGVRMQSSVFGLAGATAAKAGDISVTGTNSVSSRFLEIRAASVGHLAPPGSFFAPAGSAGNITITGGTISLIDSDIGATTVDLAEGHTPGSIEINAQDNSLALTRTIIVTSTDGDGDAGSMLLRARDVSMSDGVLISGLTTGTGEAGMISIAGTNSVSSNLDGNGNVDESLEQVEITSESQTSGSGSAGSIEITGGAIRLANASVRATTESDQQGNAPASISISAPDNEIALIGTEVVASTAGASAAGSIDISGGDISLVGGASVSADTTGAGHAGEISVTANELTITDGASISTNAQFTGDAGDIGINVSGNLSLIGGSSPPSQITTDSQVSEGGDIQITTGGRLLARNGLILASAGALGNGGDIALNAPEIVLQESSILAQADGGNGGKIDLNSSIPNQELLLIRDSGSQINADSNAGNSGTITISSPDTEISSAIRVQDVDLFDAPVLAADACSPAAWETRSSLVVEDRGGVPPAPDGYFPGSVAGGAHQGRGIEVESGAHIDPAGGATLVAVASLPAAGCR